MQKRAPTLGNILVIVLFALSCFGLLLFLWESFGGPVPLRPKGYQFTVAFPRSLALAEQSDVRISGVDVGHVVALKLGGEGRTDATLELSSQYAPIRADMHAILRQKTLLGETYVQLIPESRTGPYLPDNGRLAESQVEPSVTLDDILSALDPKTRKDFQVWMQSVAAGITGRGEQINSDFAELHPLAEHANKLVSLLASQEGALTGVVKGTGEVFDALSERDHQFQGFIVNGERTFHAAAEESQAFAEAFKVLPAFEHNSRVAFKELDSFATVASPFLEEFRPVERQLSALLGAAKPFVPAFNGFLTALGPLTQAAKKGLPTVKPGLELTVPLLENFRPVLHNFDPFLQLTDQYIPEVQAFFANFAAATQTKAQNSNFAVNGGSRGPQLHFLKTMLVLGPESLTVYGKRIGTNRANPYFQPGAFRALANGGLKVFEGGSCANSAPSVSGPANETISQTLIEQLIQFHIANAPESPNAVPAPACNQQGPFTFNGQTSQYPHVTYGGK
ncbi:MAG TPA: MlaD family protein [Solirubrobacteraceae bacterium]|jgi:phospholipid/cholesterol/gamma-HCH transport system substrate-binding protein|nr:MlaD family protein [Solirubrobacteraceae bacterium]